MASNRIGRINEEIQKELSTLLRNLKDPRVQGTMISITRVETTPDLRYAKIYVSFLDKSKASDAVKGLKSAGAFCSSSAAQTLPAICAGSWGPLCSFGIPRSCSGRRTTPSPGAPICWICSTP